MPRSPLPSRRRARSRRPVLVVLVLWLVVYLSAITFATALVLQGVTVPKAIAAAGVLIGAAATASSRAVRGALIAATPRRA